MGRRFSVSAALFIVVMLLASAYATGSSDSVVQRSDEPDVYDVSAEHTAMNAAISQAQATLDQFTLALQTPGEGMSDFSLKVRLEDGEKVEHVWLSDSSVTETEVGGVIANDVVDVEGYALGQRVVFGLDRVSDWMYVENGVLRGGFTIRVLRDQMSAVEREEFDANLPFTIE